MKKSRRARTHGAPPGAGLRRAGSLAGLVPPFALAFYSLSQPWARARVALVWGISRSPGTELLGLLAVLAGVAAAASFLLAGRHPRLAAAVHLAVGLALAALAWQARQTIQGAGVPVLAGVRMRAGLQAFVAAAFLLIAVGMLEFVLWSRRRPRAPAAGREPSNTP